MKDIEYDDFTDLMNKLSLNFKGDCNIPKIDLYFDNLKKYKLHAIKRGIDYLISTRIYPDFPLVGHISKAIKNSKHRIFTEINSKN